MWLPSERVGDSDDADDGDNSDEDDGDGDDENETEDCVHCGQSFDTIRGLKIHQTRFCSIDVEKNGLSRSTERERRRTSDGCLLPKGGKEKYLLDDGTYAVPKGAR